MEEADEGLIWEFLKSLYLSGRLTLAVPEDLSTRRLFLGREEFHGAGS
jgi:hypothetical protein